MPLYEYDCKACGKSFELLQKLDDPAPDSCEFCNHGPVVKRMSKTGFILKGSGWYVTDFRGGTPAKGSSSGSGEASSDAGAQKTADSSTSEAKPNAETTKSEAKGSGSTASDTKASTTV